MTTRPMGANKRLRGTDAQRQQLKEFAKDTRVQLIIRCDPEMKKQLKHAALTHDTSVTEIVNALITDYLQKQNGGDQSSL